MMKIARSFRRAFCSFLFSNLLLGIVTLFAVFPVASQETGVWKPVSYEGPSPRDAAVMAYDSSRQKIVLFGGMNESPGVYYDAPVKSQAARKRETRVGSCTETPVLPATG